jgi:hypothetical protein
VADVYSIRDWSRNFEKSQSRKLDTMTWVAVPVKHDGLGYRRIISMPDGPSLYCAWILMVQVAAKCKVRGVLADENGPLTADDLFIKTGCPAKVFDKAIQLLSSRQVGWLLVEDWETVGSQVSLQDKTVQDRTEQDKTSAPPEGGCPPELLELIGWWNDLRGKSLVSAGVKTDPPLSEAVTRGWSRVQRSALLREKLADLERLTSEIESAEFCREPWFRFEKLLGAKNRDGEYIVVKLWEGAYRGKQLQKVGGKNYEVPQLPE